LAFDSHLAARSSLSTESTRISDSLRHGSLLGANSDFALVFVAAQFALDGDVSTLRERAGEISHLPEGDASMPV
jgi:hypothetical protein